MFIFAIIGLSLFGDNCPRHFGTLGSSKAVNITVSPSRLHSLLPSPSLPLSLPLPPSPCFSLSPSVCIYTGMFALFVCVTQDGWMSIMDDLRVSDPFPKHRALYREVSIYYILLSPQQCGYYAMGAVYLLIFITIGAFVFANLVVAVVVTNLASDWGGGDVTKHCWPNPTAVSCDDYSV